MSFFRRRQASVQVQDSQAALVHQQQQQQVIREQQLRQQQQQASARDRDAQVAREREMEQQRERMERERERQALQRETARHHRIGKTKDTHSSSSSTAPSSSSHATTTTRAQRERERERDREAVGNALGGSPSQQQHISSSRDQASPPTNQQQQQMQPQPQQQPQQQPPPPPRERERERERDPPSSQQAQQQAQSQGSGGHKTSPTGRPAYPWSARRLAIQPVSTLIRQPGPPVQSPSPFPRYGHSLPLTSTNNGELFLFGGLVKEQIKNDLYSFSTRDLSVALIETKGEIPPPRVGHASALVSSVLIVWGGDTKTSPSERQDDALYLLNLGTREWTRVSTSGRAPPGRYGHAVTMCGTRFFVFGGQVDGEFLNDLWAFDLSSLKTPDPNWDLYSPPPGTDVPARRTGHVCVTHGEKIYMFGGTDGQYHYNDTWCFDVPSRTWRELTCIGFIPVPREGHAAALVDDVMYVFGGRGVDGKDLSDLAAFKISNSRWYMFQNMGPSPSGRSGHAMAAAGSRVFVLGGESFTAEKPDDPSLIHVLDSRHIKYPDSNRAPPANAPPPGSAGRRPSVGAGSAAAAAAREQQQQAAQQPIPAASGPPVSSPPTQTSALANVNANLQKDNARDRAMSPPTRDRALSPSSTTSRAGAMSPQERVIQQQSGRSGSPSTGPASSTPPPTQRAVSPTTKPAANGGVSFPLGAGAAALANGSTTPSATATPTITPAATATPSATSSTITSAPSSSPQLNGPTRGKPPPRPKRGDDDLLYGAGLDKERSEEGSIEASPAPIRERALSPPAVSTPTLNPTRAISPPNGIIRTGRDSPSVVAQQMSRVNGLAARSPSPSSGPPPPDAFYSSGSGLKSPTINGHPSRSSANVGADLVRAKELEIEGLKRRETWMKAALARAAKSGFVWTDGDLQESRVGTWMHDDESPDAHGDEDSHGRPGVASTVMKLKQEQAKLQAAFASQAKSISDRLAESDRIRNAAVQEAAFYRAKLAAYETGTALDVNRLERDRMTALETQVQALTAERNTVERKLEDINEAHLLQSRLREQAEERAAEAVKRAEIVEEAHEAVKREHSELREKHLTVEGNLRDHTDRLLAVTSSTSQLEVERNSLRSQVNELLATRDQHQRALDQARSALDAAGARAAEMDAQWQTSRNRIADLEEELNQMRGDLEARIQETESVAARLADVENAWAKSREEADEYRAGLTGSIGKLLDTQRELQADEDRASRGYAEKQRAMEQEMSSLRKMLKEAGQRVDAAQSGLAEHRDRARTAESGLLTLRSQVSGLRSQLAVALADSGRLRKDLAAREAELRDKSKAAAESEVRLGMLRNYLSDNGLVIDEDELTSSQGSSGSSRLQQLQNQLRETKQHLEDTEIRCQDALRDKADVDSQLRLMSNEIDRLRATANKSPSAAEESNARAAAAERKLAESEAAHRDKLQQIENDYQTAVQYARSAENISRRMKDELAKQKTINANLQNELDSSRGINGSEAGSRTRNANGRGTPMSDEDGYRTQLSEAQRNAQRLALENQDLHRRLDDLSMGVEELRDKLVDTQRIADARLQLAEELQAEVERLDSALRLSSGGDHDAFVRQLASENSALKAENRMLSDKVNLLLEEVDQPGYGGRSQRESTLSTRRDSRASSNNFESLQNELEDWHRRFVPSSNSNRPISDYDEPSRRTPTERLR